MRDEVLQGPSNDPARLVLQSGFGTVSEPIRPHPMVLEWGLGSGETDVLSFVKRNGGIAVGDDGAARMAAKVMEIKVTGTLGVVVRAHRLGSIESAASVIRALRDAGLRLDDDLIRQALARTTGGDHGRDDAHSAAEEKQPVVPPHHVPGTSFGGQCQLECV